MIKNFISVFLSLVLLSIPVFSFAQIGIGTTSPDASSVLDIASADKGLLMPRMTAYPSAPALGLTIYRTDLNGFYTWNGTAWTQNVFGLNFYSSDGTLSSSRTITMNANNLTFASTTGNLIYNPTGSGKVGIGTAAPFTKLQVNPATVSATDGISVRASGTADWDAVGLAHDGATAYLNASGADNGLAFRVNNSTSGNITTQTYQDVMRLLPNGNVGIGTTTPINGLDLKTSIGLPSTTTAAATYSATATDAVIYLTATSNQTITLPAANTANGRIYYLVNSTAASKTIAPSYVALSGVSITAIAANSAIALQSDGTNWRQFQNNYVNPITNIASTYYKTMGSDVSHLTWITPFNKLDLTDLDIVVPNGKWLYAEYTLVGKTSAPAFPPTNLRARGFNSATDYICGSLIYKNTANIDTGEEFIVFSNDAPDTDATNSRAVDTEYPTTNAVPMILKIRYKNNTGGDVVFGYSFGGDQNLASTGTVISILAGSSVVYSIQ